MVDADVLLDGFFQFFFYFRLRFSEDIYDDGLSGFRIVTDSVSSLPAAVLSFAAVPFLVCSSFGMVSATFDNERYRNQQRKAIQRRNCYQKVIICLAVTSAPNLCLWRRNFCAAGDVLLLLQRCDFGTVKKPFPLTTAAQNIHVFLHKLLLHKKHFFGWLKAANFSIVCGTVTLKSPPSRGIDAPRVHPRPRKRLSRCTLDCGFITSESPALRGFVAERGQIRGTSLYLVLKSNGPRSLSLPKVSTHSAFGEKSHTTAYAAKQGRFGWGCCHSRHEPHVPKPPLAGYQNGKLCRFWVLVRGTPEARREPAEQ